MADLYDRYRPGYPDDLYVDILASAAGRDVLEAGAGTGRATVALARHGASVLAVEPDPAMAAIIRERTEHLSVRVQQSAFEDCVVDRGSFDLVVSAQAWHWIDPVRGAAVAARALRADGVLALWWNRPGGLDGPVWDAIHAVYQRYAPALDRRAVLHARPSVDDPIPEPAPGFGPWYVRHYPWSASYDADGYGGLIQTHSDHQILPPGQLERLVAGIRAAVEDVGNGRVEYRYQTTLLTARPE